MFQIYYIEGIRIRRALTCIRKSENIYLDTNFLLSLGYVHTIPNSFCSGTKNVTVRASVHTQEL